MPEDTGTQVQRYIAAWNESEPQARRRAVAALFTENAEYLARIDATLEPFGGRFLVHGARAEVVEGPWLGDLVVIDFRHPGGARAWYSSADCQEAVALRTGSGTGWAVLVEGVTGPHSAIDVLVAQS